MVCLSLFFDVQMLTVFKQKQFDILVVLAQSFSLYAGFENYFEDLEFLADLHMGASTCR